ncbi:uncharacterized protein METZ01_LOCUS237511 [marine metagenome]|uniref:Uncharacterized protein n=1 Tax=marine metagenome TaxID=408172 RepID=A0A382HCM0_9ZZZZ
MENIVTYTSADNVALYLWLNNQRQF